MVKNNRSTVYELPSCYFLIFLHSLNIFMISDFTLLTYDYSKIKKYVTEWRDRNAIDLCAL